jgi:hypothetical protein
MMVTLKLVSLFAAKARGGHTAAMLQSRTKKTGVIHTMLAHAIT